MPLGADEVYRIEKARENKYTWCGGICRRNPDPLCTKIKHQGRNVMGIGSRRKVRVGTVNLCCPCTIFTGTELNVITERMLGDYYGR